VSFQSPVFLFGLVLVPILLGLYVLSRRRQSRYAVRFPAAATVAAIVPRPSPLRHLPPALFALALAGLITALARPQATVAVPVEQASVVLVTDASGSMSAQDVAPSRLDAARSAALELLDSVPAELRIGVVGFSDSADTVVPPTDDRDVVRGTLDGLVADGGTATGDALRAALEALQAEAPEEGETPPPSAIILLTDGKRTVGSDPVRVAELARELKIPINTVALGTADGTITTPSGILSVPPDPEAMREVARISGGEFSETADADQLAAVYERLGSQIGTEDEEREVTAGFAGGSLLLLAAAVALSVRRYGRIP
jgi:Ca-activated chloride channel family protein